ncbi:hypothetical protein [Streptomyces sp. NPDC021096]|uniref:hypothetical protein n=1 Tax=Streptomyces sp. NPDC021096 TaxID=3154792 RepID=UPI0033E0F186
MVDFLGAAFPVPDGAPPDAPAAGFPAADFFVAAFQPVPQTMQARSLRALFVSHRLHRQPAAGRPAAGRFAAEGGLRGADLAALGLDGVGSAPVDFGEPGFDAAGFEAVGPVAAAVRRFPPQIVQDLSAGELYVSQSAQRQLAVAPTRVLPLLVE